MLHMNNAGVITSCTHQRTRALLQTNYLRLRPGDCWPLDVDKAVSCMCRACDLGQRLTIAAGRSVSIFEQNS